MVIIEFPDGFRRTLSVAEVSRSPDMIRDLNHKGQRPSMISIHGLWNNQASVAETCKMAVSQYGQVYLNGKIQ